MSNTNPTTESSHWRTGFPSRFLHAEDLKDRAVVVEISGWEREELQVAGQKEKKIGTVLSFAGCKKKLVANKTNCKQIEELLGDGDMNTWIGKRVALYPTTDRLGAKRVPCIRIKAAPAAAPAIKPTQPPADDLHAQAAALDRQE